MKTALTAIVLSCIFPVYMDAQSGFQYLSSTSGAASYTVEYHGDYLFSGTGFTFRVYDTEPGESPPYPVLFEHRFNSMIDGFTVSGNTLYIAANTAGFSKWTITDPSQPVKVAEQIPENLDQAAYDIAVKGDTVFVANKRSLSVYKDNGNSFSLISHLFEPPWFLSRVRGCAVKDTVLAFTVGSYGLLNSAQDGVHLYHSETLEPIAFRLDQFSDHEDVVFGQNTDLLHVMGGGKFTSSIFPFIDPRGLFYSMDISDPALPEVVFSDTIPGISIIGDSQAISADIQNDTLYLATRTGWDDVFPLEGNVFVYDVSDPDQIQFLEFIDVGLLHFDVAVKGKTMQVASEWFGIRTIDITDLSSAVTIGDTPTGGWNETSDKFGDYMVQANEGYGLRLFDISDLYNPVLENEYLNINSGFNFSANFSSDGQYIFAGYLLSSEDQKGLRVLEVPSMQELGGLNFLTGTNHADVYQDVYFAYAEPIGGQNYISFTDVSNPVVPLLLTTIPSNLNAMETNDDGFLFVCRNDSLLVYDLNANFQKVYSEAAGAGNQFQNITIDHDTVYLFRNNIGLQQLLWDSAIPTLTLQNETSPPNGLPIRMAVDEFALYLGYTEFGLFAFDKTTLTEIDYFRTGLDFIVPWIWHLEDIVTKDGLILLVEYFGQTSILTFDDLFVAVEDPPVPNFDVKVYPNPVGRQRAVYFEFPFNLLPADKVRLEILDVNGKILLTEDVDGVNRHQVDLSGFLPGVYLIRLQGKNGIGKAVKIVVL